MPLDTNSSTSPFILVGIPDLETTHSWMGLLFCSMYVSALLGNCMILLIVWLDRTLHEPMFYFLCMLGVIDLVMPTSIVPKMLGIFWVKSREIGWKACFIQMFFVHSATAAESGLLLAMAFDRYVAICHPLRYSTILTWKTVAQIGLAILLGAILFMTPLTWMLQRLPYCASKVIAHSYCEHIAVSKLACTDSTASRFYSMVGSTLIVGTVIVFIAVSYGKILKTVLSRTEKEARVKAFSTCSSHICVMLLYFLPGMVSMYLQTFHHRVAPHTLVLLADFYLTIPSMLNPIIYSLRTKQVREALLKAFSPKKDPV
uniref:Olfactory receptor n=1 Tax=Sphenodon punctatus TaxID=8508 RepID=A0A8D0G6P8_SPHPU